MQGRPEIYDLTKGDYEMKVLILNGSPRVNGNTDIAVNELVKTFEAEGVETVVSRIGNQDIRGCIACGSCSKTGKCVFDDAVNELAPVFEEADGLVVASPVYYASANATLIACLDRLFYSTGFDKTMKVGASVVVAFHDQRHAGGIKPVLEQCPWTGERTGGTGSGRPADHADTGQKHDIPHEEHRSWQGEIRTAGSGKGEAVDSFYYVISCDSDIRYVGSGTAEE